MIYIVIPLLIQTTPFVLIDRTDPITDKRQLAYMVESEGNILAISCSDASARGISITLSPKGYYGPGPSALLWEPNALYRFGTEKPDKDKWSFFQSNIELGDLFGSNTAKANFLDRLSKNSVVHIRYEARLGEEKTVSFLYDISKPQLSSLIKTCNPKRVQELLREMKSPLMDAP